MLLKLKEVSVLSAVSAIIVDKLQDNTYYEYYKQQLLAVTENLNIPILFNPNFDHSYPRSISPYGLKWQFNVDQKDFKITKPWFGTMLH